MLRQVGEFTVTEAQSSDFLKELMKLPGVPRMELPAELAFTSVEGTPMPKLTLRKSTYFYDKHLNAELAFEYEGETFPSQDPRTGFLDAARRAFIKRDVAAENSATALLRSAIVAAENDWVLGAALQHKDQNIRVR